MKKSETITKISAALVKAQLGIGAAPKDAANPFFKSRYADLGRVMAACKEPLLGQGISVLQLVNHDENGPSLETILLHESGEFIASDTRIICSKKDDPQAMGSAITYARRYALQAAVFMPSVDDDAEWAEKALRHRGEETVDERREREAREVAARGGAITEIEPEPELVTKTQTNATTGDTATHLGVDWRKVKCHVGKKGGTFLDVLLGEMNSHQIKWLAETWMPQLGAKPTKKDQALALAIQAAVAEGAHISKSSEAPPASEAIKTAPKTPPVDKNAPTGQPEAKKADWRTVPVLCFGSKSAAIVNKTLGELDSTILRSVRKQLVPKCDLEIPEHVAFSNAVNFACDDLMVDADEIQLRTEIGFRFDSLELEEWQVVALLREAGVFGEEQTLGNAPEEVLRYLIEHWHEVKSTIGKMTPPQKG